MGILIADKIKHVKKSNQSQANLLHNDFRELVDGGWQNVHPTIRARMDKLLTSPTPTVFKGRGCVRRSSIGWLFAHLSRLLGGPLVWKQGENVTTTVSVEPTPNGLRCWHRQFTFPDGTSQLVQTTKVVKQDQGLMDAVGSQGEKMLHTKMRVWIEDKSLCFESTGYYLYIKNLKIRVPSIFTPGKLYAEHRDEGGGKFRYIMAFKHPIWGETFYQDGIFEMIETEHR